MNVGDGIVEAVVNAYLGDASVGSGSKQKDALQLVGLRDAVKVGYVVGIWGQNDGGRSLVDKKFAICSDPHYS